MQQLRAVVVCLGVVLVLALTTLVQAQDARPSSTPQDRDAREARVAERDRIVEEVRNLVGAGKIAEAVAELEKVLLIEREVFGEAHEEVVDTLEGLAGLEQTRGEFPAARGHLASALTIKSKLYGERHWKVVDARLALKDLDVWAGLAPEQRKLLEKAAALKQDMHRRYGAGKIDEAIDAARGQVRIWREILGEEHPRVADGLHSLGSLLRLVGRLAEAEPIHREGLRIQKQAFGEEHPAYANGLNALAVVHYRGGETAKAEPLYRRSLEIRRITLGEDHPAYAESLNNLAELYGSRGEYAKAEPLHRQTLEIRRRVLGEEDPEFAESLHNLASTYMLMGRFERARPLSRKAVEIYRRIYGESHPRTAMSLMSLGWLHTQLCEFEEAEACLGRAQEAYRTSLGENSPRHATSLLNLAMLFGRICEYAKAEALYVQAVEIFRVTRGPEHPDYAAGLHCLALLLTKTGEYTRAELLFRRALDILRKALGEDHIEYVRTLGSLACLYWEVGMFAKAEPLFQSVLEVRRRTLGEKNPDYARTANNLAMLYKAQGRYEEAEALLRQAAQINRAAFGEANPEYGLSLNNLAQLYQRMGDYIKAEPLNRQAVEISRKALGEEHPVYARELNNLAMVYEAKAENETAARLYRESLAIRRKVLGPEHPDLAASLGNLALLYWRMGRDEMAEPLGQESLAITRKLLDTTFAIQSERQQLRMTRLYRGALDSHLCLRTLTGSGAGRAYALVLAWKGAVLMHQALSRVTRREPAIAPLFTEFEATVRRLAALSLATPTPAQQAAWRQRIRELTDEKEARAREIALKSEAYREAVATGQLTPEELQASLPPGVRLVDFLQYRRVVPVGREGRGGWRREQHVVAFVIPPEGEIAREELGPAEAITGAVDAWRSSIRRGGSAEAGTRLRELVWEPLRKHIEGTGTVLVSPDGALNRLPFAALPGQEPGTYLLEEVGVAVVPVPQLLPGLLAREEEPAERETLLLVGDVDYAGPGEAGVATEVNRSAAGTRPGHRRAFGNLPATRVEIEAIGSMFARRHESGRTTVLCRGEATEAGFRERAPKHRWLHLATHGFFAPAEVRSALSGGAGPTQGGGEEAIGYHPGLLSGLALCGANTPPEGDGNDGILTALEVASLDLTGVEIAVLSACETGLGEVAGGEGALGLQRAFQVAGARTTVTSLWSVGDRVTRQLMERFYENLWERKLPKLEALRQAQLWLLREGARTPDLRRGLGLPEEAGEPGGKGRLSPYHWAAFVLSGDWR